MNIQIEKWEKAPKEIRDLAKTGDRSKSAYLVWWHDSMGDQNYAAFDLRSNAVKYKDILIRHAEEMKQFWKEIN